MPDALLGQFPSPRSLVLAYHGCDKEVGLGLISGAIARLSHSSNTYDWIGGGAYFFENDYDRALHFARSCAADPGKQLTRGQIKEPFVVGAVVDLGLCLDLSRQQGIAEAADAFTAMCNTGMAIPKNEKSFEGDDDFIKRKLDRAIINYLHKFRQDFHRKIVNDVELNLPPYDTVRSPFPQGEEIAPTSAFKRHSHVQIAVRNAHCVLGYFLPRAPMRKNWHSRRRFKPR